MLPFKKQGSVAQVLIRKMKGKEDYESLKDHNEQNAGKEMMVEKPRVEKNYDSGMDQAVEGMMQAAEKKDAESFKQSLKSFVGMMLEASKEEKTEA